MRPNNNGVYSLKRIDVKTGTAKPVADLSGFPYAEKPIVHDGVLP